MDSLFTRPRQFLDQLEILGPAARVESFTHEALETGGIYLPARKDDNQASHLTEIDLHGIQASGSSELEAQLNWMRIARSQMPLNDLSQVVTV